MKKRKISKHAINRAIERDVLSQNIKLNKKQIKRNTKKAYKKIDKGIRKYFAVAISNDELYEYKYSELSNNGLCKKYVTSLDTENLVTVINNVDFGKEIKKHSIQLRAKGENVVHYILTDYVYKIYNETKYLFVINKKDRNICSFKCVEE